jgi:hypothetical protein
MPDTVLSLGGFVFADPFSVPQRINGGGRQRVAVHRFLGGARVVDALGPDDDAIRWAGRFRGEAAVANITLLDVMRRAGRPVLLTWWSFAYQVLLTRLAWQFERFYEVGYEIECTVVQDLEAALWGGVITLDQLFAADTTLAASIGGGVPTIAAALAGVTAAQAGLGTLNGATTATLAPVVASVGDAAAAAAAAGLAADGISGPVGGVAAGGDPTAMGAALTGQAAALQTAAAGVQSGGVFARMSDNLGQ